MWGIKLIIFIMSLAPTYQQFPRLCVTLDALRTKECCPAWEGDGSACGARSGRGSCEDVELSERPDGPQYPFSGLDDREKWPLVFYNRTCQCAGNFMGFNCGDCKFGYFGDNCDERRESLRRNIFHLTRAERNRLISYLNLAKQTVSRDYVVATGTYREMENGSNPMFADVSVYDVFVWMHYYVSRSALLGGPGNVWGDVDFAHWAPAFPPWHRVYLLHWEHEIRKLTGDMDFSIPYWDWRDAQDCDVCTDELMGSRSPQDPNLVSPSSVFSSWRVKTKHAFLYLIPYLKIISPIVDFFSLIMRQHKSFLRRFCSACTFLAGFGDPQTGLGSSSRLGMHAALHVFMNGSMSSVQGSANDPIFLLHHAFVDSLYEQWLRRHTPSPSQYPESDAPIGHNGDYHMAPFIPLHRNKEYFISSKDLGYEYSYLLDANQRLAESMRPYLDELQDVWPWLLLAGLCGGLVTVTVAALFRLAKRRYDAWPQKQPLMWSNEAEASHHNYQTAM
uniref:Tyrosinase n=1 Tax=Fundulus heteroclitus TaxID=8078 RepID=A0A3Q2PRU3_FUNHE